jgi:uncharacterized protein
MADEHRDTRRPLPSRHISVSIDRPPAQVYAFAADVANLGRWASGLADLQNVRFVERNAFGVLDHDVELDSGATVHNSMRVIPNMAGSEVIFTLICRPDMSAEQIADDAATVHKDLARLKRLVEAEPAIAADEGAAHVHHAIDYIELTVTDVAAATRFYTAAFGWRFNHYGPNYAGIQGDGREVGGLRGDKNVVRGGPLVVLYSRNLDATLQAVREAGGRVVQEPFDFPGGRRFHFTDPSGNELGVWAEA